MNKTNDVNPAPVQRLVMLPTPVFWSCYVDKCAEERSHRPEQLLYVESLCGWYCEDCIEEHELPEGEYTLADYLRHRKIQAT